MVAFLDRSHNGFYKYLSCFQYTSNQSKVRVISDKTHPNKNVGL